RVVERANRRRRDLVDMDVVITVFAKLAERAVLALSGGKGGLRDAVAGLRQIDRIAVGAAALRIDRVDLLRLETEFLHDLIEGSAARGCVVDVVRGLGDRIARGLALNILGQRV